MNFYRSLKLASFTENVQVLEYGPGVLDLSISGKRYMYLNGIPGEQYGPIIERLLNMKNKALAGQKLSAIIKNIEKYLETETTSTLF